MKHLRLVILLIGVMWSADASYWWMNSPAFQGQPSAITQQQDVPVQNGYGDSYTQTQSINHVDTTNQLLVNPENDIEESECPPGLVCIPPSSCWSPPQGIIQARVANFIDCGNHQVCCVPAARHPVQGIPESSPSTLAPDSKQPPANNVVVDYATESLPTELPQTECPSGMKCISENFCDSSARISTVFLNSVTRQKKLIPCMNPETRQLEVCCNNAVAPNQPAGHGTHQDPVPAGSAGIPEDLVPAGSSGGPVNTQPSNLPSSSSLLVGNQVVRTQNQNTCPAVPIIPPVEECAGRVSDCWSVGVPDLDCIDNALCCFDGCANVCQGKGAVPGGAVPHTHKHKDEIKKSPLFNKTKIRPASNQSQKTKAVQDNAPVKYNIDNARVDGQIDEATNIVPANDLKTSPSNQPNPDFLFPTDTVEESTAYGCSAGQPGCRNSVEQPLPLQGGVLNHLPQIDDHHLPEGHLGHPQDASDLSPSDPSLVPYEYAHGQYTVKVLPSEGHAAAISQNQPLPVEVPAVSPEVLQLDTFVQTNEGQTLGYEPLLAQTPAVEPLNIVEVLQPLPAEQAILPAGGFPTVPLEQAVLQAGGLPTLPLEQAVLPAGGLPNAPSHQAPVPAEGIPSLPLEQAVLPAGGTAYSPEPIQPTQKESVHPSSGKHVQKPRPVHDIILNHPSVEPSFPVQPAPVLKDPSFEGNHLDSNQVQIPQKTVLQAPQSFQQTQQQEAFVPAAQKPFTQCPSAMKCVLRENCDFNGVMTNETIITTPQLEMLRVPLIPCVNRERGNSIDVCCRDPNYKDPWPNMNSGGKNKNSGNNRETTASNEVNSINTAGSRKEDFVGNDPAPVTDSSNAPGQFVVASNTEQAPRKKQKKRVGYGR